MSEKNNLDLIWNKVRTPNPKHVKNFNRGGGFKGSATNTQYIVQLATEVFGPNGIGWGTIIDNEDYVTGGIASHREHDTTEKTIIHVVRGHVWYMNEGEKYATSQQFGQTTFVGVNKNGSFTDEEAPKKSATDMMLKCLSLLGFSADIHMGLWDDNKYVNDAKSNFSGTKTEPSNANKPEPMTPEEMEKEYKKISATFGGCKTIEKLNQIAGAYKPTVTRFDDNYTNEAKTAYTENVTRINKLNS